MWLFTDNDGAAGLLAQATRVARLPAAQFGAYAGILLGLSATLLIWFGAFYFIRGERGQSEQAAFQRSGACAEEFGCEPRVHAVRAAGATP
jgi:hypothetical protein